MTREKTIEKALAFFDDGGYVEELSRRVAVRTESQKPEQRPELYRYLEEEITPAFQAMGHDCQVFDNPVDGKGPVLLATRIEDENLPTVLGYGHGDVIRGLEDQWYEGLSPWETVRDGDRLYGRGTADNKGQHTINMNAMRFAMETRGHLASILNSWWRRERRTAHPVCMNWSRNISMCSLPTFLLRPTVRAV